MTHQHTQAEEVLYSILEGTAKDTGEQFFHSLVKSLAQALGFRYSIVGKLSQSQDNAVDTLAVWNGEDFSENFMYDLTYTPCSLVISKGSCFYAKDIQTLFPNDLLLREMDAQSYMGVQIRSSLGKVIGLLVVLDTKEMKDVPYAETVLEIFASRAAAELERLEAEKKILESEAKLSAIIENTNDLIFSVDANLCLLTCNKSFTAILKKSLNAESRMGINLLELAPDEKQKMWWGTRYRKALTGIRFTEELPSEHSEPQVGRNYEVSFNPIRERGVVTGLSCFMKDITGRKKAERALRLTQYSVDSSHGAIFWIRPDSTFAYANQTACDNLGYSREELLGMSVSDIDPDWTLEHWNSYGWSQIKNIGSTRFESRHQRKDGKIFPVEITSNYVNFDGNECIFAFINDISERKRAEEALVRSESRYRSVVEDQTEFIVRWKPTGELTFVNGSFCR